jgi:hypothetical protein
MFHQALVVQDAKANPSHAAQHALRSSAIDKKKTARPVKVGTSSPLRTPGMEPNPSGRNVYYKESSNECNANSELRSTAFLSK